MFSEPINIKIVPNARRNKIVEGAGRLKIYLTAPAVEGKANAALIELLAEHFGVKKNNLRIIRGHKCREKVIEINVNKNLFPSLPK